MKEIKFKISNTDYESVIRVIKWMDIDLKTWAKLSLMQKTAKVLHMMDVRKEEYEQNSGSL